MTLYKPGLYKPWMALFALLTLPSLSWALPIVTISEDVGGGIGEYTVDIASPVGETWYLIFFAAENEQSVNVGGDGAFVDNEIGSWNGKRFAPNQWQADFSFTFEVPGDPFEEELVSTLDLGDFTDLFGSNTFAHAYWPTSYLDFSAGSTFSLIGPNETRGGFKFHSPIVASQWVALVENNQGQRSILTGEADGGGGGPTGEVPEPSSILLFALGLMGVGFSARRRAVKPQLC